MKQSKMRMDQEFFTFRLHLHRLEFNVTISSELTIELSLKVGKDTIQTQQDLRFGPQRKELDIDESIVLTVPLYRNANNKKKRGEEYQQRMATLEINTISLAKNLRTSIGLVKFDLSKFIQRGDKDTYECYPIEKSDYEGKVSFSLDFDKETAPLDDALGFASLTVSQNITSKSPSHLGKSWNGSRNRNTVQEKITKIPVNQKSKSPLKERHPLVTSYSNTQLSNTKSAQLPTQSLLSSQCRTPSRKTFLPEQALSGVSYKNLVELQEKNRNLDQEKQALMDTMSQNNRIHAETKKELTDLQRARDSKDDVIDSLRAELSSLQQVQQMNQQLLTDLGIQQVAFQTISGFYQMDFDHLQLHSLVERIQQDLSSLALKDQLLLKTQAELKESLDHNKEMAVRIDNLEYQTTNQKRKQQQDEQYASEINDKCASLNKYNRELVDKQIELEQTLENEQLAHEKQVKALQAQIDTHRKEEEEARKFEKTYQDLYKTTKNKLGIAINLIFEDGNEQLMEKVEAIVLD